MCSESHTLDRESASTSRELSERIDRQLQGVVAGAHRVTDEIGMHPYHVLFDLGLVGMLAFVFVFLSVVGHFRVWSFIGAFVFTTITYETLFIKFKQEILDIHSRSYLQDLLTYVLPVWIASAWALGVKLVVVLDLIGLQLALLMGFIRIGCFLGGCCYGVTSKWGIEYPEKVFEAHEGNCQSFSPGEDPGQRVFPIQLVESVVNFVLFGLLFVRVARYGVDGLTLPLYLLCYSVYRFLSDFFRLSSARPNWGPLSEAQWVSVGIAALTVAGLLLTNSISP